MRDFRAAPVPIRLSCPFSNGITLNYYARALTCNGRVLRVISVNPFERELQLIVAAPFLNGLVRCQVASVTRSKRQASTYELDLRFVDAPILTDTRGADVDEIACPSPILSADIAQVATEVAGALESSMGIPFAKAYGQVRDQNRHMKLLALIAALMNLSREKALANVDVLNAGAARRPNARPRTSLPLRPDDSTMERRVG
jgi:hypothetical protein